MYPQGSQMFIREKGLWLRRALGSLAFRAEPAQFQQVLCHAIAGLLLHGVDERI